MTLTTAAVLGLLALQSCIYDYAPDPAGVEPAADTHGSICINTMLAGSRSSSGTPAPTAEEGSGESFTVLFWQREEYLVDAEQTQNKSYWLAPYLATSAPKAVTEYTNLPYDTSYPYPVPETSMLYATGYAPADALKPDPDMGYCKLNVPAPPAAGETDKLDRGRYDFLGCDAWNEVFKGCQQEPFAQDENKLIFRHLASKLLFNADRDAVSMENKQYVRFVEITNVRMSIDGGTTWTPLHTPAEFRWTKFSESDQQQFPKAYTEAIKAAQTLNNVTTMPAAGYATTASEAFSTAAGFTLTRRALNGHSSVDRVPISGHKIDSCYVCNPFVNGIEQSNLPIRLKMDISAELSFDQTFPNSDRDGGTTTDDVTFTRRWTDIEVEAIYETNPDGSASATPITAFRAGMEYRVYIHFSRTGVNLVARELLWNIGGLHYIGILGSDPEPTPTPPLRHSATPPLCHSATMTLKKLLLIIPLLASCSDDPLIDEAVAPTDRASLIEQGRYLTARNAESRATGTSSGTVDKSDWFPVGTLYRLLAYTKDYNEAAPDDATKAEKCRFNKVAWEGENGGLRFINVTETPDKWFGFSPHPNDEESSTLKSIDFYGFTYGETVEPRDPGYIPLDGVTEEDIPTAALDLLKRTEGLDEDGNLPDLMRGELHNQNIQTAGRDANANAQSVLPFRHCFSCLRFMAVQQYQEGSETTPQFGDGLEIVSVKVTNTYSAASVYLKDGLVEVADKDKIVDRALNFSLPDSNGDGEREPHTGNFSVTTVQREFGEMILPPTFGGNLKNGGDGYVIGLELTVKCPSAEIRQKFLNADPTIEPSTDVDGNCCMTITKASIINNFDNKTLYLKQNTGYTVVFSFQYNTVRIITVIPMVEEWLQGENSTAYPGWDEQPIGQPQMFDNLVWSDRNLGAAHFDPITEEFEYSMGYFYQAGRNIPYYPFKKADFNNGDYPRIADLQGLRHYDDNITAWHSWNYRLFPVVDNRLLTMGSLSDACISSDDWCITQNPQMSIPESKPEGKSFGFVKENKLADTDNMYWNKSYIYQPVSGAWRVPTSAQFMSIFPTTPHAGNLSFKDGGNNYDPMVWGDHGTIIDASKTETLRITVPCYVKGHDINKSNISAKYRAAWNTLRDNDDPGTTHATGSEDLYGQGSPHWVDNVDLEPDGDPEDGYASIYVISRKEDNISHDEYPHSKVKLPKKYADNSNFYTKEWGTIYGIKRVYTNEAYRIRWRALIAQETGSQSPGIVVEVCRYRCSASDTFDETTYMNYDWDHPVARLYFPVAGLGDYSGEYINFGTECEYATSDPISGGKTSALQIKITGNNTANTYIAVVKSRINRHFGMQVRPIWGGGKLSDY